MHESLLVALALAVLAPSTPAELPLTVAQEEAIQSAESAAPSSVSAHATIRDWEGNVLREGSNGWTCLPDRADTEGTDPWCIDEVWAGFLDAYMNQTEPQVDRVGIAYMLAGDAAVSNTDPYATEPTEEGDWVTGLGGHVMIAVPDTSALAGMTTEHENGGPWVMWPDTPYAHIMVPIDAYMGGHDH